VEVLKDQLPAARGLVDFMSIYLELLGHDLSLSQDILPDLRKAIEHFICQVFAKAG
jgi:hypothetical protein